MEAVTIVDSARFLARASNSELVATKAAVQRYLGSLKCFSLLQVCVLVPLHDLVPYSCLAS